MAEVLYRVLKEEESNPMLASFLISTIRVPGYPGGGITRFSHSFLCFNLSRHLGFYPQNNFGEEGLFFNLASGRFKSVFTDPEIFLDEDASKLWHRFMRSDLQSVKKEGFNGSQRKMILDNLVRFYKMHVNGMGDIRSLEILHAFFLK